MILRVVALPYALIAYAGFVGWFLYTIGFLNDWSFLPKTINSGEAGPAGEAILVNLAMVLLFGVQHTIMARSGFKRAWTRIIPAVIERSTFVLVAAVLLSLLLWQWRPLPATIWRIEQPLAAGLLTALSLAGAALLLYTTFLIDHWDLVGLRQVWAFVRDEPPAPVEFKERSLYRWLRHPMMLGILIWIWSTPHMTQGHLLFAASMSAYLLVGIRFEERGLLSELGEPYAAYRRRVPMLIPGWRRGETEPEESR